MSKLLTMKEAAEYLRISRRTLERYIESKQLAKYKVGGRCLIEQTELIQFLKRNRAS